MPISRKARRIPAPEPLDADDRRAILDAAAVSARRAWDGVPGHWDDVRAAFLANHADETDAALAALGRALVAERRLLLSQEAHSDTAPTASRRPRP